MPREQKHFNRCEIKYRVARERAREFEAALAEYVHPDPNCVDERGYPIYSVYYDTPALTFFWDKVEGHKYRRKLRFRRYGESPDVFLEIKQRIDRTLQKRRVRWPLERVSRVFQQDRLDEEAAKAGGDRIASEIFFLWRYYALQPTMGTSYRRRAFFGNNESDLRITFDSRVQFHPNPPGIAQKPDSGKYLVDPDIVIMEIKYSNSVPLWLCKLLGEFDLSMVRLSKYCTAIDLEHFQGQLT